MSRLIVGALGLGAWTALVFWAGSTFTGRGAELKASRAQSQHATAAVAQVNQVRQSEHSQAQRMAAIGDEHEQDRQAAPAVAAAVVAELRTGHLRLRNDLATCHTARLSQAAAGAVERDAHAQLRAEVAGAAVQIGRDADDHVRASQTVIRADRDQP